jgi:DNA-binding MarR family transcriptional regulator
VTKRGANQKLKQLDEYIHVLMRRFCVRPSVEGEARELSGSEIFACNILGRKHRCTMSELASECGLALSSMTGVVDHLVEKGYVKRAREDPEDRRKVFVVLDARGQKIYQQLLEVEMEMIITMMEALRAAEQDVLLRVLGKAVGALEQ